ncbi:deoxyribonuclease [Malaciobacter mytili LMG 24559]|uniref:Deoxyribonuclease n=1 Tax=Malaciobacter mytili LMG 24559 TaxID=1032238 RepID=A0AAX2AKN3_9BACT|nr:endonuclease [Malaciobacter mytili]AXH14753.1 DNA-specific endonuclease I [Malaciobacter mytili LMG 24559]RXK16875.1 deoxyribonuclease [Malaciobacter mytili LMG 24559]
MKALFLSIILLYSLNANEKISSFTEAKKILRKIYSDHQVTFYAGCKYNYKDKKNMIDRNSCGYKPKDEYTKSGKLNERARRIEWEHVIPAENFGRAFKCWNEGDEQCVKENGKKYKGRKCCSKVESKFKFMEADLHNLVPAIGELNANRSNYKFGIIPDEKRFYGENIDFEVDSKAKIVEPKESIRGDIARIYFYFEHKYKMPISKQQKKLFEVWNKQDPVDEWEREKNKRVEKIQGDSNIFIK